jgi:hypothetical protein
MLAGCFGPSVADGSLQCEIGDECPPSMFCRPECGRRCYFSPSGTCGADAAVPVDTPPPVDAPQPIDGPIGIPDVPVIPPDVPVITIPDAPAMTADACMMIAPVDDAGITICTTVKKPTP